MLDGLRLIILDHVVAECLLKGEEKGERCYRAATSARNRSGLFNVHLRLLRVRARGVPLRRRRGNANSFEPTIFPPTGGISDVRRRANE